VFHETFGSWHAWRFALIFDEVILKLNDDLVLKAPKKSISFPQEEVLKAKQMI
jgi:hypothetical protein